MPTNDVYVLEGAEVRGKKEWESWQDGVCQLILVNGNEGHVVSDL
jgi:hypothetical protein